MPIKKKLTPEKIPPKPAPIKAERALSRQATTRSKGRSAPGQPTYTPQLARLAQKREEILGPPLAPQALPGATREAASVVGQCWTVLATYQDPPAKIVWVFFEGGTLLHDKNTIGLWRQQGAAIVAEVNGRYSQFQGEIKGSEAWGSAKNVAGLEWTWTASITG